MLINDGHCHSIIPTVLDSGNWSLIGTRCHRKSSPTPTRNQCSNIMIHHNFVIRLSILLIVSLFLNYCFICPNIAFILTDWHRIIDSDVDIGVCFVDKRCDKCKWLTVNFAFTPGIIQLSGVHRSVSNAGHFYVLTPYIHGACHHRVYVDAD